MRKVSAFWLRARGDVPNWSLPVFALLVLVALSVVSSLLGMIIPPIRVLYLFTIACAMVMAGMYLHRFLLRHPRWRYVVFPLLIALVLFAAFGGRPYAVDSLRATYKARLRSFLGVRYAWGGESHLGIDCSGLARTALWEAMLLEGVKTGNPRLLGPAAWKFWWRDMSARAMGEGAYGYTQVVGAAHTLAGRDISALAIGDLAVPAGGEHVLIYLGNRRWIEANPEDGRVVENEAAPYSKRGYFSTPVTFAHWRMLADP